MKKSILVLAVLASLNYSITAFAGAYIQQTVKVTQISTSNKSTNGMYKYAVGKLENDGEINIDCFARNNNIEAGKISLSLNHGQTFLEGYTLESSECTNLISCLKKEKGGSFSFTLQVDETSPKGWLWVREYSKGCFEPDAGMP